MHQAADSSHTHSKPPQDSTDNPRKKERQGQQTPPLQKTKKRSKIQRRMRQAKQRIKSMHPTCHQTDRTLPIASRVRSRPTSNRSPYALAFRRPRVPGVLVAVFSALEAAGTRPRFAATGASSSTSALGLRPRAFSSSSSLTAPSTAAVA